MHTHSLLLTPGHWGLTPALPRVPSLLQGNQVLGGLRQTLLSPFTRTQHSRQCILCYLACIYFRISSIFSPPTLIRVQASQWQYPGLLVLRDSSGSGLKKSSPAAHSLTGTCLLRKQHNKLPIQIFKHAHVLSLSHSLSYSHTCSLSSEFF